jgi:hypothetical protein|tara:strand:+ start:1179 stop:1520 length:342 start_codon:yes stop_codon:yes gene_type:complete
MANESRKSPKITAGLYRVKDHTHGFKYCDVYQEHGGWKLQADNEKRYTLGEGIDDFWIEELRKVPQEEISQELKRLEKIVVKRPKNKNEKMDNRRRALKISLLKKHVKISQNT